MARWSNLCPLGYIEFSFFCRMEAVVEDPRYEGLDEIDRAKVGNNVSRKTSEQIGVNKTAILSGLNH